MKTKQERVIALMSESGSPENGEGNCMDEIIILTILIKKRKRNGPRHASAAYPKQGKIKLRLTPWAL